MDRLRNTLIEWINGLKRYNEDELLIQPAPGKWSIGQVYMHLLSETNYFLSQVKYCLEHDENILEEMNEEGRQMFLSGEFPDVKIDRGPGLSEAIQPVNKQMLTDELEKLRQEIDLIEGKKDLSDFKGKTRHPGLGYFNAMEWLQFSEMHMRHHFRQKRRIDEFLSKRE
jgi:hypothetical protein